jgi:hypothetical protein
MCVPCHSLMTVSMMKCEYGLQIVLTAWGDIPRDSRNLQDHPQGR